MAQLLDLPEEVLENNILPFLSWNELLRCRRVCKTIKVITQDYIRLNPEKTPEIQVTVQTGKNLEAFIAMGIPTTKLFLNNPSGHHFYDNLDTSTLTKFLTTYGPMIKTLRVEQLSLYPCFNEWTFLEALTNLKTFEAEGFSLGLVPSVNQRKKAEVGRLMHALSDPRVPRNQIFIYPENFKNLDVLKIGHNEQYCITDCTKRIGVFLKNLPKLEYISFPFCPDEGQANYQPLHPYQGHGILGEISHSVSAKSNLKYVDFINFHKEKGMKIEVIGEMYMQQSIHFMTFIASTCIFFDVKLLNVNPAWYHQHSEFRGRNLSIFGRPVVSLVNLHACVFPMNMPNLERITIYQTSRSNVSPTWNVARPDWPVLKTLEINVNSKKAVETETPTQDTALIFKCLWKDILRGQLSELSLKFDEEKGKDGVAIPKTEDIVSGCPNLKKLRIVKWPGKQKALITLWRGLTKLEEVSLEYCRDMGNVTFVGEDVENPVFLQLKNLKKLTLKGLDQMPKITNTLFALVLAKMKLSHLIIGSDKPLEKVTKVGIAALLEGIFAETIEKFPFKEWSLATMSAEDFQEIAKRFRSFNML